MLARFLVGVGEHQVVGAGLQRVDHVLGEVLAVLHDRQVRTEGRSLRAQRVQSGLSGRRARRRWSASLSKSASFERR